MTHQEIFNRVWHHFIIENRPMAKDTDGNSYYRFINRIEDGFSKTRSCPVGLLIPLDIYETSMEDYGIILLHKETPALQKLFKGVDIFFLAKLQEAHGTTDNKAEFEKELRDIAKGWSLTIPKVELAV